MKLKNLAVGTHVWPIEPKLGLEWFYGALIASLGTGSGLRGVAP